MHHKELEDIVLWDNFRDGDDRAFSQIYFQYAKTLYQYGLKFTSNCNIIEDAIHDLFIDLMDNRKSIGSTDNIKFYLLKSFKRKLIRLLRKESRYGSDEHGEFRYETKSSVEEELINEEISTQKQDHLDRAINELSPRQKEAIFLRFKKELEYAEIAEILGMGIEASRNLIYRAVKAIRESVVTSGLNSTLLIIFKKFQSI